MGNNVAVSHGSCMLCPVCACAQVLEVRHLLSQDTRVSNHHFFSLRKDIAEHHRKDAQPPVPIHKAGRDHEAHRKLWDMMTFLYRVGQFILGSLPRKMVR